MKPRFSILTLLGVTAYVAVNFAAYAQPLTLLPHVAFFLDLAILLCLIVVASGPTGSKAAFAQGMLLTIVVFSIMRDLEPAWPGTENGRILQLEYHYFIRMNSFVDPAIPHHRRIVYQSNRVQVARLNTNFAIGLLGGCLALWRYRRLKRRDLILPRSIETLHQSH